LKRGALVRGGEEFLTLCFFEGIASGVKFELPAVCTTQKGCRAILDFHFILNSNVIQCAGVDQQDQ